MSSPKESTEAEVNNAIERVASKKDEWARLPAVDKATLLQQCLDNFKNEIEAWVRNGCLNTGYEFNNPAHGHLVQEVYLKGPAICANWMNSILFTLRTIAATGAPPKPLAVEQRRDGSFAATVFPNGAFEKILAGGLVNQVFTKPESKALAQFNPMDLPGGVVAVLGAGNYDGPNDILHTLFLDNKVAVFKPNPVNDFTAANTFKVFKPLIDRGYLAYVYGAVKVGQQLVNHPKIDEVTMTGSCMTYDAIVWGGASNKPKAESKEKEPLVKKPVKAELGSVNPYIITPGVWTQAQIDAHAEQLVVAKMMNNGHICASPQVVVTCKNWAQRDVFLAKVRNLLASYPATRPYYPACDRSYKQQLDALSKAVGQDGNALVMHNPELFPNQQHPLFATGVPHDAFVVKQEAFCPVLAEICLDTPANAGDFLPVAVEFANNKIWGSLTCTLIIDTASQKTYSDVVEKALDDLKFGAISLNQVSAYSVIYGQMPWGAYPRHSMYDIQSGIGKLGNSYCIENPVKCLIRAPFSWPAQPKIKRGPAAVKEARLTVNLLAHQSWYRLSRLLGFIITGL